MISLELVCRLNSQPIKQAQNTPLSTRHTANVDIWCRVDVDLHLGSTSCHPLSGPHLTFHCLHPVLSRPTFPNISSPRRVWDPGMRLASRALALTMPSPRQCNVHSWVSGYQVLLPTPFPAQETTMGLTPVVSRQLHLLALPTQPHAEAMLTPSLATCNLNLLFHHSPPVLSRPTVPNVWHKQCFVLANNPPLFLL